MGSTPTLVALTLFPWKEAWFSRVDSDRGLLLENRRTGETLKCRKRWILASVAGARRRNARNRRGWYISLVLRAREILFNILTWKPIVSEFQLVLASCSSKMLC